MYCTNCGEFFLYDSVIWNEIGACPNCDKPFRSWWRTLIEDEEAMKQFIAGAAHKEEDQ